MTVMFLIKIVFTVILTAFVIDGIYDIVAECKAKKDKQTKH